MKNIKSIYALAVGCLLLSSCDLNNAPEFNDADAFVALTNKTMSVGEADGTLKIPVLLTSLSGIETTVDFEVTDGTAKSGIHYTLANTSKTLTFTKDEPTQYIVLNIIDNDVFGGDVKLSVAISNPKGVNLGASKTCGVTISDDEHPLAFILGSFSASGASGFDGSPLSWTLTIEKDDDDVSKVWIDNLVPGGSGLKVYGKVNDEKTEIQIPVGQDIDDSYPKVALEGFLDEEGEEPIPTGGNITGVINANGTITIKEWFGSHVYNDAAGTQSLGWFEIVMNNSVWTKK